MPSLPFSLIMAAAAGARFLFFKNIVQSGLPPNGTRRAMQRDAKIGGRLVFSVMRAPPGILARYYQRHQVPSWAFAPSPDHDRGRNLQ
jgi:hypothetical protein